MADRRPSTRSGVRAPRLALGRAGEDAAALFLEAHGYRIAARNLRIGRTELDLVARKGPDLVFCEVKTRRGSSLGEPEESVTGRKRARIQRAAEAFLARHTPAGSVRFDVLAVTEPAPGRLAVRHIEGAFRPW